MSAVAIIPARGGSRRIPRKNIRMFHGKPIIAYSIMTAYASGLFDGGVWVSTEDEEIAEVARSYGATILVRSERLAADHIGTQEIMADAIATLVDAKQRIEYACCIYATAPMLRADDLVHAFNTVQKERVPYAYADGWYYFGAASAFLEGVPLSAGVRNLVEVGRYIDINTEDDWKRAEEMYAALHLGRAA